MATTMPLENMFAQLALRPSTLCRQCRRTFSASAQAKQPARSATASFTESLQNSRTQHNRPRAKVASATADPPFSYEQTLVPDPVADGASVTRDAYALASESVREAAASRRARENRQKLEDQQRAYTRRDLDLQVTRRWKVGEVYAPHDLSGVEMAKWKRLRRKPKPKHDVLDQLGINPLHHYKNFSIMSEYITDMGRIKHSNDTSLRPVNQRRMAKAIRRAMGIGLMPGVHRHPEILRLEMLARDDRPRR